jgi:hypothetical protein
MIFFDEVVVKSTLYMREKNNNSHYSLSLNPVGAAEFYLPFALPLCFKVIATNFC